MKQLYVLIFLFVITLSLSDPTWARGESGDFVSSQSIVLESTVRENHDLADIAKTLSEFRSYSDWASDMDPNLKLYVAMQWFEQNHVTEGLVVLDSIDPKTTNEDLWMYYRSVGFIHTNKPKAATTYIAKLAKKFPKDPEVLYIMGSYLAETSDLIGAIDVMTQAIGSDKNMGKAYLQRGIYYMLSFSGELAILDFKKALKTLPKTEVRKRQQVYLQMGLIYYKVEFDKKKAKKYFTKGVNLDPKSELVAQVKVLLREGL